MFTFWKLLILTVLVIAALVVLFGLIGFLAGVAWLIVKLAVAAAIIYFVVRFALRK
jgi:hypothetical protein